MTLSYISRNILPAIIALLLVTTNTFAAVVVELATHLRSHGVAVVVSDTFTVSDPVPEAMRVCLGRPAIVMNANTRWRLVKMRLSRSLLLIFEGCQASN